MRLNNLKPSAGSKSARHRVGRGIGSGWGKTAGRGHKGQKSRAGGFHKVGFEGGQMPLYRRLPKRGFTSRSRRYVDVVRLSDLQRLGLAEVDLSVLKQAGIVSAMALDARIVKSGELSTKVSVRGLGVTKGARAAIEAAGGALVDEPVADSKPTKHAAARPNPGRIPTHSFCRRMVAGRTLQLILPAPRARTARPSALARENMPSWKVVASLASAGGSARKLTSRRLLIG